MYLKKLIVFLYTPDALVFSYQNLVSNIKTEAKFLRIWQSFQKVLVSILEDVGETLITPFNLSKRIWIVVIRDMRRILKLVMFKWLQWFKGWCDIKAWYLSTFSDTFRIIVQIKYQEIQWLWTPVACEYFNTYTVF